MASLGLAPAERGGRPARMESKVTLNGRQLLTFRVAGEPYALPVDSVQRVEPRQDLTPVPGAPSELPGVFVSQGQLVAALDPRTVLGLRAAAETDGQFVVVARDAELVAGLLVDWVDEVVPVDSGEIQTATGHGAEYATGQVQVHGEWVS